MDANAHEWGKGIKSKSKGKIKSKGKRKDWVRYQLFGL
jgi:hypothetical protein